MDKNAQPLGLTSREKYWSEIDDAERIKRMRSEVKSLQTTIRYQGHLIEKLLNHKHSDGDLVYKIDRFNDQTIGGGFLTRNDDETYF